MQLRPEQRTTVEAGKSILVRYKLLYLAAQVRTGKTIMSMTIAHELRYHNVCFITKKMAMQSVESDLAKSGLKFGSFIVRNFEQVPNLLKMQQFLNIDLFIIDESSTCGAYPKPGKYTKLLKELIDDKPIILMSGTPTPESPSQIFHQFWLSKYSPFSVHKNFYAWAKEYVKVQKKRIRGYDINDYSKADEAKIKEVTKHYMVNLSQEEAGFESLVEEEILYVKINENLYKLMAKLKKDKVYKMKSGDTIVADTPVRMQSVFHQLSSGTIKVGDDKRIILDNSKAEVIKRKFAGKKIAIFYKFIAEGDLLRKTFPNNTSDPAKFNESNDLVFICQMISGRMGTNLSTCDYLIAYNIDFSATTYWQMRARMQTKDRLKASKMVWIFSERGLEKSVYKAVSNKRDFTLGYFKQYLKDGIGIETPEKSYSLFEEKGVAGGQDNIVHG